MNLLILYTKNKEEVFNRKSAIGSYINCLSSILDNNSINVFLNGRKYNEINNQNQTTNNSIPSKYSFIKKLIPKYVKRYINDKKHLLALSNFENELIATNQKYDAILEFYNLGSKIGYNISKAQNIPLYITYDGPIIEEYKFFNDSKPFFLKKILIRQKLSLKHAAKIIVYSNPMKAFVKKITGIDNNVFIHQNVDFTRFDIMKDEKEYLTDEVNICFIGSFLKWHQVKYLVDAFENLIKQNLNANLFLVGDGMERENIEKYVLSKSKTVKSKITFTGFLDGEELFELKKQMHIGVMPGSNWYGAPNKIFEYGAMKMAVIAPNTPTINDLFTNEEIVFFKWKNKIDLNNKLFSLVNNNSEILSKSKQLTNKIVTKYTPQNTEQFYKFIISE